VCTFKHPRLSPMQANVTGGAEAGPLILIPRSMQSLYASDGGLITFRFVPADIPAMGIPRTTGNNQPSDRVFWSLSSKGGLAALFPLAPFIFSCQVALVIGSSAFGRLEVRNREEVVSNRLFDGSGPDGLCRRCRSSVCLGGGGGVSLGIPEFLTRSTLFGLVCFVRQVPWRTVSSDEPRLVLCSVWVVANSVRPPKCTDRYSL
jgi:hypothetical protein